MEEESALDQNLDFLYVDYNRICSLLTGLERDPLSGFQHSLLDTDEFSQNVGLDFKLFKSAKHDVQRIAETRIAEYIVYWKNVYSFIDVYRQIVASNNNKALINKIVRISGEMELLDFKSLGAVFLNYQRWKYRKKQENIIFIDSIHEYMLDNTIGSIKENDNEYWFTMDSDIHASISSLSLKHGMNIGKWNCYCIIDTQKHTKSEHKPPTVKRKLFLKKKESEKKLQDVVEYTLNFIRDSVGIGEGAIGVTPLIIFRELDKID